MITSSKHVLDLSTEHRHSLQSIWHPKKGDHFFLINSPNTIYTYGPNNHDFLVANRLDAYPLFKIENLLTIIEDYAGYFLIKELTNSATSIYELFCLLWEQIINILQDSESAAFWNLTIPIEMRNIPDVEEQIQLIGD